MHPTLPITVLSSGEIAVVHQIIGSREHVRRLDELGLRIGTVIEMVRGGSPCIVRIGHSTLCFRDDELLRVLVSPRKTA